MSLVASSVLMAGGYKIPEASLNAVALSAANIAHNKSADAAYYNPANMVFMSDENHIEADLTYIGLNAVNYKGTYKPTASTEDINSEDENFLVPSLHYVSGDVSGARFGLSVVVPGGLSKRWKDSVGTYSAEEFTLETVELNPTIALPIGDKIGVAIGFRLVHSSGVVKSTSPQASRDMTGDSIDFGYNLALAYKATSELELGLTYRSQIDLTTEGDAKLSYIDFANDFGGGAGATYTSDSSASLTVALPAALNVAVAYTLPTKTTIELVYERNFWSAFDELDFNYGSGVNGVTNYVFGSPIPKNWKDTNAFRLGVTQEYDRMTIMAGMVYDETPVPDETIGFELPDSDSLSVSLGGRYQVNEKMDVGIAALYSMREDREVNNDSFGGEFTNSDALLISVGMGYKF